jgi:hypothetical protein
MKSAAKQQRCKAHYMGAVYSSPQYNGTRTQPGYAGLPAGRKLTRRIGRLSHTDRGSAHHIRGGGL